MTVKKQINILEINNTDIVGKRFNGYDIAEYINNNTNYKASQIVNYSSNKNSLAVSLYNNEKEFIFEQDLATMEYNELSIYSQLSISTNFLVDSPFFKDASLLHFHMFHNSKYNLNSIKEIANEKPTVITLHDMWFLTGRCAQPFECTKWLNGCKECNNLNTVFPMHIDNCSESWKQKEKIFKNIDVDLIVASPFMLESVIKRNIIQKNKIHLIPFGLDLNEFYDNGKKNIIRKKWNIPEDNIVLFLRAQNEFKGTEYILESLKKLSINKNITVITCGERGLLDDLKNKYQIIDLGVIETDKIIDCFRACDIFLMTSKGESFGLMAIEAMACSRPVIIFDNTALKSVTFAPDCGYVVENKNIIKLKEAIEKLSLDNKERVRRGKLGRTLAEKNYDINTYNKRIINLYESVLKRKHKKFKVNNFEIDYTNHSVNILLIKMKKITKLLFGYLPNEFNKIFNNGRKIKVNKSDKINYSDDNAQNLIKVYNDILYEIIKDDNYKKEKSLIKILIKKIYTFKFLIKKDRRKLLKIIKSKIIK